MIDVYIVIAYLHISDGAGIPNPTFVVEDMFAVDNIAVNLEPLLSLLSFSLCAFPDSPPLKSCVEPTL
jgi:hypothetical protein